ncbi:hypothetical protein LYNGBM3L_43260 [Moorena producens 3L]|uniref:Uncharacterized protein n=1 Tax=Moorena producens 3L TaxID=489825 RepID=F4XWF0_9CYAN|nr:hypothetical protein LYNGBM3L_43260 [Moorena producens 3L]OLT66181.1 hypothetical protein BI334_15145 [Moorena producens 3L]
MLGFREQGVGFREQGTGNREQGTGNREQNREQGTGKKSCVPHSYEKRCKYDQIMINAISFLKIKLIVN